LARQNNDVTDIESEKSTLLDLNTDRERLRKQKSGLAESAAYSAVVAELLKDTGIKTKIVKEYLPVINQLTNKYLQVLDFFVSFHLDDTFKESIKSRHRDEFSYDSFSEGEKQRIDLALLFTWRQVAKMKNSVATNLLILDETFDSSLDVEGVDNLTSILDTLGNDTNVFVISHKGELLDEKFDRKIEFVKRRNFSTIL
jgi:DNA repair exonuclease SbcCD ATPase subunit